MDQVPPGAHDALVSDGVFQHFAAFRTFPRVHLLATVRTRLELRPKLLVAFITLSHCHRPDILKRLSDQRRHGFIRRPTGNLSDQS